MKKLKQLLLIFMLTLSLAVPSAVPVIGTTTTVSAATQISISNKSVSLYRGKTKQLKVRGTSRHITWKSKNSRIVSVTSKGKITAKAPGKTTIVAKVGKQTFYCKVTVKSRQNSRPAVQSSVWLSATGSKYHRIPNCGRMNPRNARKVSLAEAKRRGYTACRNCFR